MMKVDIENHNFPDLVLEMCYANTMNIAETSVWSYRIWLTMGGGHCYVIDETESARCIFSTMVTGGTDNTKSSLGGGWG